MFFRERFFKKIYLYELKLIIEKNNLESIQELINFLYDKKDDNGKLVYDIYNINKKPENLSLLQKINTIWFFFLYWIFITPYQYIKNGNIGFCQDSKIGIFISKLIGKHYSKYKINIFKSGWCEKYSKDDFMELLQKFKINSFRDFYLFFKNNEDRYFIIEDKREIYKDKRHPIKRFFTIILMPIIIILFFIVGSFRWFKFNEFNLDSNGKIRKIYDLLTK